MNTVCTVAKLEHARSTKYDIYYLNTLNVIVKALLRLILINRSALFAKYALSKLPPLKEEQVV